MISVGYDSSEAVFYGVYYKVQENSYSPNLSMELRNKRSHGSM